MLLVNVLLSPYALFLLPLLYFVLPYVRNRALRQIPGPSIAAFSNLWLLCQCRRARRFEAVDQAHKKYGRFVRIQPSHVSIADDAAIPVVYGHGNGFLKSDFYDAFVSTAGSKAPCRGLFNTRDRAEHTRKRKIVSNTFSVKSIGQFEPYIHANIEEFVKQWDRIADSSPTNPQGRKDFVELDALHWFNYLAFDVIGDLAFGAPFGMVRAGADTAEIRTSPTAAPTTAAAIEVLNRRGEVSATLGCMPWLRPYAPILPDPFFSRGMRAIASLAGIAVACVRTRLESAESGEPQRKDLLARLMEGRDERGELLGREELTAEALTQLIAGSDTTSNTMCALLYHVLRTEGVQGRLQEELDGAVPAGVDVPTYGMLKDLPYLDAIIKETLRIHSTSSLGLPRLIPPTIPAGIDFAGKHFPCGTVLSVPSYTIHHSPYIWGTPHPSRFPTTAADPKPPPFSPSEPTDFDPPRFLPPRLSPRQKSAFIPFSQGPRACVGRNVAEMELALMASTVFLRWEFELRMDAGEWRTREGFLRKPVGLRVGLRRRPGR